MKRPPIVRKKREPKQAGQIAPKFKTKPIKFRHFR